MERDATLETERDYGSFYRPRRVSTFEEKYPFFFARSKSRVSRVIRNAPPGNIYIFFHIFTLTDFFRGIYFEILSLVHGNTDFRKVFSEHVQYGRRSERGGRNEARSSVHAWLNWRRCNTYNNMVRRIH